MCYLTRAVIRNYLAVVLEGKVKRKAADTLSLRARGHLQALHNAGEALVLKARVLTLRVLTDDGEVHVVVTRREARERLAQDNGRVDVELLAHGDIPRDVTRLGNGGEENAYSVECYTRRLIR